MFELWVVLRLEKNGAANIFKLDLKSMYSLSVVQFDSIKIVDKYMVNGKCGKKNDLDK